MRRRASVIGRISADTKAVVPVTAAMASVRIFEALACRDKRSRLLASIGDLFDERRPRVTHFKPAARNSARRSSLRTGALSRGHARPAS
jgi:hypothetical protein